MHLDMTTKRLWLFFYLTMTLILLSTIACGGKHVSSGKGTGGNSNGVRSVKFVIHWPEKTRLIPSNTQSIRFKSQLSNVMFVAPRPDTEEAKTVTISVEVPREWEVLSGYVTAHPDTEGQGTPQAQAYVYISNVEGQTYDVNLGIESTISNIEVATPASRLLQPSQSIDLSVTAYGLFDQNISTGYGQKQAILTEPKDWEWSLDNTKDFRLVSQGDTARVTQITPGTARVSVRHLPTGKLNWVFLGNQSDLATLEVLPSTPGESPVAFKNLDLSGDARIIYGSANLRDPQYWSKETGLQTMSRGDVAQLDDYIVNSFAANGDFVATNGSNRNLILKKRNEEKTITARLPEGSTFVDRIYISKSGKFVFGTYRKAESGFHAFIWTEENGFTEIKTQGQEEPRHLILQENYDESGVVWGFYDRGLTSADGVFSTEYVAFDLPNNTVGVTLDAPNILLKTNDNQFKIVLEASGIEARNWVILDIQFSADRKTATVRYDDNGIVPKVARVHRESGF
jgi:hypothetical protein